ncbi:uncharacterized protein EAE97_000379 [Botrytis byssoidea]|uniref:Uncharacterized protein n=1 Tax=Botrytis byssoidea TaxID=139641 RepID=A0A9P5IXG7_9HELO|nr:uncharacterized protein EAE97_000379 [Botrytis byssoidea]KAF7955120.1 hypothetical protein EAE97_000379 [Botrytis byssoidea]
MEIIFLSALAHRSTLDSSTTIILECLNDIEFVNSHLSVNSIMSAKAILSNLNFCTPFSNNPVFSFEL